MPDPTLERLWCRAGRHAWYRSRRTGPKPHGCPEHGGPIPPGTALAGDLYSAALTVALDPNEHPDDRKAAGALMHDLADTMRRPAEIPRGRHTDAFPSLREAICQALDHRIYGES
jgi:hypothetical protein